MPTDRITRLYSWLLNLYPEAYRTHFADSMRQTFEDVRRYGRPGASFYLNAFGSAALSLGAEHFRGSPGIAAAAGLACLAPLLAMNAVVSLRLEPYLTWLRPDTHSNPREWTLIVIALLLMPLGAFLAARPLWTQRRFFWLNASLALALVVLFSLLSFGIGEEVYRCEVLGIPNCD